MRLDKSLSVVSVGYMDPQLVGAELDDDQYTMGAGELPLGRQVR